MGSTNFITKTIKDSFCIILILILATVLLSINIDKTFIGHHDWNGAFWGSQARDYLKVLNLNNEGQTSNEVTFRQVFYSHYSPVLPVLFSISAYIFGLNEISLRLVPMVFSLIMIFFIYKIGEKIYGKTTGVLAAALAIVTPMYIYFGKLPDHEPIAASLITASFYFYLLSLNGNKKAYFAFLFFLLLSLLESWPTFFIVFPLVIFSIVIKKEKINKSLIPLLIACLVLASHLFFVGTIKGVDSITQFIQQGFFRIGKDSLQVALPKFSLDHFLITEARYAVIYYTRILIFLSLIWIVTFLLKIKATTKKEISLLILLIYPSLFIFAFKQLAFIHDYKLYYYLPFIALTSARIIEKLTGFLRDLVKQSKSNKYYLNFLQILVVVAILFFVATERIEYLTTLLKTSFNKPGYELGMLINQKTLPENTILINSIQFKEFFEVFVTYYSDRRVQYQNITLDDFLNKESEYLAFDYLVLIHERDVDPNLESYLSRIYYSERSNSYNVFHLKKKLI